MKTKNKFTALLLVLALTIAMIPQMPVYAVDNAVKVLGEENLLPTKATVVTIQKSMGDGFAVIEHLALSEVKTGKVVSADIAYETTATEFKVSIYPHNNFSQNTAYVLKIFTDKNQYNYNLTTEKYVDFSDYETLTRQLGYNLNAQGQFTSSKDFYYKRIEVPANPAKGFYFPYFLEVPTTFSTEYSKYLLVTPNNTGTVSNPKFHEDVIASDLYNGRIGYSVSGHLGMAQLIPTFPSTDGTVLTHSLDRDTVLVTAKDIEGLKTGNIVDIEKQLVAMIEDAKAQFKANGVTLNSKIVLEGFSSSGQFANRFSMIYPEIVEVVILGTTLNDPAIPYESINGKKLNYPLGVADYETLFGKKFNLEAFQKVKQYWYIGEYDNNFDFLFMDGMDSYYYSAEESSLAKSILGNTKNAVWKSAEKYFAEKKLSTQVHVYKNVGHNYTDRLQLDIVDFIKANLGKPSLKKITPSVDGN